MAKIVLTTYGSSGDLNPILALGLGLQARGHTIVVAVEKAHRAAVMAAGLVAYDLPGDTAAVWMPYRHMIFGELSPFTFIKVLLENGILPTLPETVRSLRDVCLGADLLVATVQQAAAGIVAELTRIPWVSVALSPALVPSASVEIHPALDVVPHHLRPLVNRAAWGAAVPLSRRFWDPPINRVRTMYGLRPRRDALTLGSRSPFLTAVAVSPIFFPRPKDWPPYARLTGFMYWDTPHEWIASASLTSFLDDPRPLVAVSSGSMAPLVGDVFEPFYRTSITAIRRSGARAIVIGASPDTFSLPLPPDVLAVPFVPFSQVYPHCAAVIHHGGIGTMAQCLRAGVPELVVPWGVDQYFHGARVTRLGAGRWMRRRTYTPPRASQALNLLIHQSQYRERSRAIAGRIAHEDGVVNLCTEIDALLDRAGQADATNHPTRFIGA
jgi:rhamnosyltransferase subunit B